MKSDDCAKQKIAEFCEEKDEVKTRFLEYLAPSFRGVLGVEVDEKFYEEYLLLL